MSGSCSRATIALGLVALVLVVAAAPARAQSADEDESRASRAPAIREVIRLLDHEGLQPRDRTADLPAESRDQLNAVMQLDGAADIALLDVMGEDYVVAMYFRHQWARDRLVEVRPTSLVHRDVVIAPDQCRPWRWRQIVTALTRRGADLVEPVGAKAVLLRSRHQTLRSLIEQHRFHFNAAPDFERSGWRELKGAGLDHETTLNPLSSCSDRSRVVVIDQAGVEGDGINADDAGWVWNRADHALYPAGMRLAELDRLIDQYGEASDRLEQARYKAARRGNDLMKALVVQRQLDTARLRLRGMENVAVMQRHRTRTALRAGETDMPTLAEVQKIMPANPFNGSDRVQAATWAEGDPPVAGTAGWNYDRDAGRIWPNTDTVGEHRYGAIAGRWRRATAALTTRKSRIAP